MRTPLPTSGLTSAQSTFINAAQALFQHRQSYYGANQQVRLLCMLIALLAGLSPGRSQCPTGIINLTTQAQVNAFATQYPTCTNPTGQVIIAGPDISDLSPLASLTSTATLSILNNPLLTSLSGLSSLSSVGSSLILRDNASMISLSGLENVTSIGSITIQNNGQLRSIEALGKVSSSLGAARITNNASLTSLSGLGKIPFISGLIIQNCPQLTNMEGLTSLATIGNSSTSDFRLTGNTSLSSLSGLTSLTAIYPDTDVRIRDNPALSSCVINVLCQRLGIAGQATIINNGPGCNSTDEVQSACAGTDIGIITQPPSQSTVLVGSSVSVPVSATGNITAYQWYKGNLSSPVAGQTSATLSLANLTTSDAGSYSVVVSSPSTSLTSTAFTLTVTTQPIRYVRAGGSGDGSSWATASGDLQAMINAEGTQQVWVAAGIYKPTSTTARDISFSMKNGVSILGGFPASGNPGINQRVPDSYTTTLSGDIGTVGDKTDNSFHVIENLGSNTLQSAILDGFVITGGNADGSGSVGFTDVGGGILIGGGNTATLLNCRIVNNFAIQGGGIYFRLNASRLINCSLINNSSQNRGGGLYIFAGPANLLNCTLIGNHSAQGSFIYGGNPSLTNCILWNNDGENAIVSANVQANYCLIEPAETTYTGTNNLTADPQFVNAAAGDYRLLATSPAINAGNTASYTAAGGPPTDLAGNVRIQNGTIDMGAYETGVPSDLIPLLYVTPSLAYSTTTGSVVVDVFEINVAPTSGLITVHISKSPQLSLSFDPAATSLGGKPVQNSVWSFDATSSSDAYILTTTQVIGAGGKLSVGLSSVLTPGQTKGTLSVTATLAGNSGGDAQRDQQHRRRSAGVLQ